MKDIIPAEVERLLSIWRYWENEESEDMAETEEALHPDHLLPQ